MPGSPDQERAHALTLVGGVAGVVGVDVSLGQGGRLELLEDAIKLYRLGT
jgi:hypothetical protein